jgi:tetratricopeptide (TPR) repeat protein
MDPTEEALLRGLDGSQPLGAFLREEESVRRTVYALLAAGLLELQGGAGEATEGRREVAAKAPAAPARQAPPPARQAAASPAKPTREPPPKAAPARPSKPAAAQPAKRAPTQPAKRAPTQPVKPATALPAKPAPGPLAKSSPAKLAAREPQKAARPQPTSAPDAAASHPPELAALAQKLHAQNHFDLLGVPENATPEVVRRASERLLAQVHPDRYSGESRTVKALAEQIFRRVTEAQQALSDPRKRQEHVLDKRRAEREASRQQQAERALAAETAFRDGETALRARDYESALRWFGKALELYPDEGDHHAHYGWALYLCHPSDPAMLAEALEHVRRGLKTASHREMPYLFMGRLYKALGRPEVAERMFTRAVQIQPECVEALRELRLIAMRREKSKGLIGRLLRR